MKNTALPKLTDTFLCLTVIYVFVAVFTDTFGIAGAAPLFFAAVLTAVFLLALGMLGNILECKGMGKGARRAILLSLFALAACYRVWELYRYFPATVNGYWIVDRAVTPFMWRLLPQIYQEGSPIVLTARQQSLAVIFLSQCIYPVAALLFFIVVKRRKVWSSILFTALPIGLLFTLRGLMPSPIYVGMVFGFWIAVLLRHDRVRRPPHVESYLRLGAFLVTTGMVSAYAVFLPNTEYTPSEDILSFRQSIMDGAASRFSPPDLDIQGMGSFALLYDKPDTVRLDQTGNLSFPDVTALYVQSPEHMTFYLRGYSSSIYSDNQWRSSPDYNSAINPLTMLPGTAPPYSDSYLKTIQIDLEAARLSFILSPYRYHSIVSEQTVMLRNDDYLYTETGSPRSYSVRYSPYSHIETYISGNGGSGEGDGFSYHSQDAAYPRDLYDSVYMSRVMAEYLQVPDSLRGFLEDWTGWGAQSVPYYQWEEAAAKIAARVSRAATYTLTPGKQPSDRDFVEYFLAEGRRGYCVHFASATVMLLRTYGIPARFVEGYVVEQDAFGADDRAAVPAENAHAWAEIWVPNRGWVPVEGTPPAADDSILAQRPRPNATATATPTPSPTPTLSPGERPTVTPRPTSAPRPGGTKAPTKTPTPRPVNGGQTSGTLFTYLLLALVASAAIGGLFVGLPRGLRRHRQKQYNQENTSAALLSMYRTLKILEAHGAALPDTAVTLAQKARFSPHLSTPEELAYMTDLIKQSLSTIRTGPRARRKRWILYMKGL